MNKIFNFNKVDGLLPAIYDANEAYLKQSTLEHLLTDKGFDVKLTTESRLDDPKAQDLIEAVDRLLEEMLFGVESGQKAVVTKENAAEFRIQFY